MFLHPKHRLLLLAGTALLSACIDFRRGEVTRTPEPEPVAMPEQPALKTAEQSLAEGNLEEARFHLGEVPVSELSDEERIYRRLLEAELALAEDRPLKALHLLPAHGTTPYVGLAARAEEIRARALFRIGDAVGATRVLLRRGAILDNPHFHAQNEELLWDSLLRADLDSSGAVNWREAEPEVRGWIELALITRSVWTPPQSLENRIEEWRTEYPGHPADARIEDILARGTPPAGGHYAHIGLLLPMTGAFAATGEAVRDGFLSAYYRVPDAQRIVRIYDTGPDVHTFRAAYRKALDAGAEFMVGPLRREFVNALVADGQPAVPVLALNYLDDGMVAPFNFYQWGLAPEDEARQAAERAVADGQYRAIVMVPDSDWGSRILAAFRAQFEPLGGYIVADRAYDGEARDHSTDIRELLAIDWSEERHRTLTNALGFKTEFEPRRRQDVDLIFLAGNPKQARILGPQLRFHRSLGLPMYATSSIYDGEKPGIDLDRLRFCDMPWMLAHAGAADERWSIERGRLEQLFPQHTGGYARLVALGQDAFSLVSLIENGHLQPGSFFPAATGTLNLDENGTIRRRLPCVEIDDGELVVLGAEATALQ